MRPITAREQNLLVLFGLSIFLVVSIVGFRWLIATRANLYRQVAGLALQHRSDQGLLQDEQLWRKRGQWLSDHQPVVSTLGKSDAAFLEFLQTSTRSADITIVEQRLNEALPGPNGQGVSVDLELHGSLQSLVEWLATLQNPKNFRSIPRLTLKSGSEPPNVSCSLTTIQWYRSTP